MGDLHIHVYVHTPRDPRLDTIVASLARLTHQGETIMSDISGLDAEITTLTSQVANETTVEAGAVTLIEGFASTLAAAVAAAEAAGATPAQVQAFVDLGTTIDTSSAALSAAVVANTPAAAPPVA